MTCDNGDAVPASTLAIIDVPAGTQHAPLYRMTCIIIRRGAYEEFDRLYNAFGHQMPILWDRRAQADTAPSAYHPDRREPPSPSWTTLGFVVVDRPSWAVSYSAEVGLPA